MSWKGIKHNDVGLGLDGEEFHSEELHELAKGVELPEEGNAGDFFYLTTDGHLYIWKD